MKKGFFSKISEMKIQTKPNNVKRITTIIANTSQLYKDGKNTIYCRISSKIQSKYNRKTQNRYP